MYNLFVEIGDGCDPLKGLKNWSNRLEKPVLETVYLSVTDPLPIQNILEIFQHVKQLYHLPEQAEVTLEMDPQYLSMLSLRAIYGVGINRLSLTKPNCDHILEGFTFFDSVNIDGWFFDGVQHLSRYDLRDFEQFEQVRLALVSQKFFPYDRYHFCHPGAVCQYLKNILEYRPYIGIGAHAHGRLQQGDSWVATHGEGAHRLSEREFFEEFLLQNFSLYPGIDSTWCQQMTGRMPRNFFDRKQWQDWVDKKQIDFSGNRVYLSGEMFFTPEKIIAEIKI